MRRNELLDRSTAKLTMGCKERGILFRMDILNERCAFNDIKQPASYTGEHSNGRLVDTNQFVGRYKNKSQRDNGY